MRHATTITPMITPTAAAVIAPVRPMNNALNAMLSINSNVDKRDGRLKRILLCRVLRKCLVVGPAKVNGGHRKGGGG